MAPRGALHKGPNCHLRHVLVCQRYTTHLTHPRGPEGCVRAWLYSDMGFLSAGRFGAPAALRQPRAGAVYHESVHGSSAMFSKASSFQCTRRVILKIAPLLVICSSSWLYGIGHILRRCGDSLERLVVSTGCNLNVKDYRSGPFYTQLMKRVSQHCRYDPSAVADAEVDPVDATATCRCTSSGPGRGMY